MTGPVPKRSSQRIRRNKVDITEAEGKPAEIPPADPYWDRAAIMWYESLAESGQAVWFQQADWAYAWVVADTLSAARESRRVPGAQMMSTIFSAMNDLLTTEGARRRLRIELSPKE